MNLNERLESVEKGVKAVNEALEPLMQSRTHIASDDYLNESTIILRKHTALIADWEAVREESDVLREELKEDKWLTVFRTVTDQADGMMSSLEKAVNRCQVSIFIGGHAARALMACKDFIWKVHKRGAADSQTHLHSPLSFSRADQFTISLEVFSSLLESYEAKKKYVSVAYILHSLIALIQTLHTSNLKSSLYNRQGCTRSCYQEWRNFTKTRGIGATMEELAG